MESDVSEGVSTDAVRCGGGKGGCHRRRVVLCCPSAVTGRGAIGHDPDLMGCGTILAPRPQQQETKTNRAALVFGVETKAGHHP
eukprot:scaffold542_cov202-Alexandrium_tamarense.AAC.43